MKKTLAVLLAVLMALMVFTGCSKDEPAPAASTTTTEAPAPKAEAKAEPAPAPKAEKPAPKAEPVADPTYTYTDSVSQMATNWNPHTYQTTDDSYPREFVAAGFYSFLYNDELHPLEGADPYEKYVIVPEMASEMPIDITVEVREAHPQYNIPAGVDSGYAYRIPLNKAATWENGKKITAQTYVDSMKRLLAPQLLNYRASDYYLQEFSIAGAEAFANQGQSKNIGLGQAVKESGCESLDEYLEKYGDQMTGYINWAYSFGVQYDWENHPVTDTEDIDLDIDGFVDVMDDAVVETPLTIEQLVDFYVLANDIMQGTDADTARAWAADELYVMKTYPEGISWDTVGCYAEDDYNLVIVLSKSMKGFQLLYNLGSSWLVEPELYDKCLKNDNGVYTSTYNTNVATTLSYGPYKLVSYQTDKAMRFEKNENWYGWTDGKHVYVDPNDGETYPMYQTTAIDTQKVEEASTRKLMFLKGELMTYGLQSEDFAQYRSSEYCYVTPDETIFFLILNGYEEALNNREAASDFDKANVDLQTMLLPSFRKAVAVTYDKELFAATVSPSRSGGYGIIGTSYIYDPETGATYRETDQAKQVLCDFYSVDVSKYPDLDAAVDSITGYDPEKAKELYAEAFADALAAGYITDANNDGISDQTVTIEYCLSADSAFMTKTIDYLNEKMNEVTAGTPFDGKVKFVKSAPYGNDWSVKIRSGLSDTVLGGWSGSKMNPFSLTNLYTDPAYQYDGQWFDATSVRLTLTVPVNGVETELTMNLRKWSEALNGATVVQDGVEYNFGEGQADVETRLDILAAIEGEVLKTYDYIPMLQNAGMSLLSQKAFYVVEEYNPVLGRGGIQYLKYNYNDAEWAEYVKSQGGQLKY